MMSEIQVSQSAHLVKRELLIFIGRGALLYEFLSMIDIRLTFSTVAILGEAFQNDKRSLFRKMAGSRVGMYRKRSRFRGSLNHLNCFWITKR